MSLGQLLRTYDQRDVSPSDYYAWAQREQLTRSYGSDEVSATEVRRAPLEMGLFSGYRIHVADSYHGKQIDARVLRTYRERQEEKCIQQEQVDTSFFERRVTPPSYKEERAAKGRFVDGEQKRCYHQSKKKVPDKSLQIRDRVPNSLSDKFSVRDLQNGPKRPLPGLIFMCNDRIRKSCFRYGVFGMPMAKRDLIDQVAPGTKLFLFEFEARVLWGIFEATCYAGFDLEQDAYRGSEVRFPVQVRFRVYKKCVPLAERDFREALKENYFQPNKFSFDLTVDQVLKLIRLFSSREIGSKSVDDNVSQHPPVTRSHYDYGNDQTLKEIDDCIFERDHTGRKDALEHYSFDKQYVNPKGLKGVPGSGIDHCTTKGKMYFLDSVVEDNPKSNNLSLGFSYDDSERLHASGYYDETKDRLARERLWLTEDDYLAPTYMGSLSYIHAPPDPAQNLSFAGSGDGHYDVDQLCNATAKYSSYAVDSEAETTFPFPYSACDKNLRVTTKNKNPTSTNACHAGIDVNRSNMFHRKDKSLSRKNAFVVYSEVENKEQTSGEGQLSDSLFRTVRTASVEVSGYLKSLKDASRKSSRTRKSSVWSRLSGPASFSSHKDFVFPNEEDSYDSEVPRNVSAKKRKSSITLIERECSRTGMEPVNDNGFNSNGWEDASHGKLADPYEEEFVIDFKRRNMRRDKDSDMLSESVSNATLKDNGVHKGRRKIIRPHLINSSNSHIQLTKS